MNAPYTDLSGYYAVSQPKSQVILDKGRWAHCTYASTLRTGEEDGSELMFTSNPSTLSDFIVMSEVPGQWLHLIITHGRYDPAEEMDDWGFDHDSHPAFASHPKAHAIHQKEDGVYLLTFNHPAKPKLEFIPLVEGLLFYKGAYYGDWSFSLTAPEPRT